jgi:two-component system, OmpR family, response regulator QseB
MRALVVEDDPMIGKALSDGLKGEGYTVDWARDGVEAEAALMHDVYDVALLDLGLPRRDGLEVLKRLRRSKNDLPVLILTARDAVAERVAGLDSGADDYLVKPFDLDELLARMRVVLRRRGGNASPLIEYGALVLDPRQRRVTFRGTEVALSAREFAVLEALAREPGAIVTRARLEDSVYGWGEEVGSNTIEVYLHYLRKKLDATLIRNVRGVGYRLARVE